MARGDSPGLAPLSKRGIDASAGLTPQEDAHVLGPIRQARADALAQWVPNMPGVAMCDRLLPLVAEGLLALLRMYRDGLDSGSVDLDLGAGSTGAKV